MAVSLGFFSREGGVAALLIERIRLGFFFVRPKLFS